MKTRKLNPKRLLKTAIGVLGAASLLAVALPRPAAADVVVRAKVGPVRVQYATPRTHVVQRTGPRILVTRPVRPQAPRCTCCNPQLRPPKPGRGRFVWVPGHFAQGPGKYKGFRVHKAHFVKKNRHGKHFARYWIPGHWERVGRRS
jgi:hypothetical protein